MDAMKETAVGRDRITAARKREDEFLARAVQQSDEMLATRSRRADDSNTDKPVTMYSGDGGGW